MVRLALLVALGGCVVEGDVLSSGDGDDAPEPAPDAGAELVCACAGTCGQLHDVETSRPLTIRDGALPLVQIDGAAAIAPDDCGRYPIDAGAREVAALASPDFRPTVTHLADGAIDAFALRTDTDARWTAALGESAVDAGALLVVFVDTLAPALAPLPGEPVAGVQVTPGSAAYFADPDPAIRRTPSRARSETGAGGAALISPVGITPYTGLSLDCGFGAATGADTPGTLEIAVLRGACTP